MSELHHLEHKGEVGHMLLHLGIKIRSQSYGRYQGSDLQTGLAEVRVLCWCLLHAKIKQIEPK